MWSFPGKALRVPGLIPTSNLKFGPLVEIFCAPGRNEVAQF
jgi:hypothetical protein